MVPSLSVVFRGFSGVSVLCRFNYKPRFEEYQKSVGHSLHVGL